MWVLKPSQLALVIIIKFISLATLIVEIVEAVAERTTHQILDLKPTNYFPELSIETWPRSVGRGKSPARTLT